MCSTKPSKAAHSFSKFSVTGCVYFFLVSNIIGIGAIGQAVGQNASDSSDLPYLFHQP